MCQAIRPEAQRCKVALSLGITPTAAARVGKCVFLGFGSPTRRVSNKEGVAEANLAGPYE